jgi:hypothetical protein
MHRGIAYLEAIEEINRAERRLARVRDAAGLSALQSALDAAKAAWLLMPEEWRAEMAPPPERSDYPSGE